MHLDHVQIAIPAGGEDLARAFFNGLLGLAEIPRPEEMHGRGGCWFQLGDRQLHVGVDPDFRPAKKAHIALAVADLHALRNRLSDAGHQIVEEFPLSGRERFFSSDPFGNRMEFIDH